MIATMHESESESSAVPRSRWDRVLAELRPILVLWALLSLWSLVRTWIPAVNEPHYLCKAKHWWDPSWCDRDFFLTSSNPHLVYYITFGWLTRFLSLTETALIARAVALLTVAVGWRELTRPFLPRLSSQALALTLFLLCQAIVNFSGEWLVGGTESKVLSYGLAFLGLGLLMRQRPLTAAALMGLATAYHPLVGVWITLCLCGVLVWWRLRRPDFRPSMRLASAAAGIWLLCSLPGLVPALLTLAEPVDEYTRYAGDYLQVYYRLKHHLDPMEFAWWRYASYAVLLLTGLWGYRRWMAQQADEQQQRSARLLIGVLLFSLLVAAAGVLIGLRFGLPAEMPLFKLRLKLLKFYPFRVFDVLVPLVFAVFVTAGFARMLWQRYRSERRIRSLLNTVTIVTLCVGLVLPFSDRDSSRMSPAQKQAWLQACQWIRSNADPDALFLTPNRSWAFKWFAQRAEYVTFKDCPQDASGIVEWNERLSGLRKWAETNYDDRYYSNREVAELVTMTGITHAVVDRLGPFEQEPVFENDYYRIYQFARP